MKQDTPQQPQPLKGINLSITVQTCGDVAMYADKMKKLADTVNTAVVTAKYMNYPHHAVVLIYKEHKPCVSLNDFILLVENSLGEKLKKRYDDPE